jgi:hypothetical protein
MDWFFISAPIFALAKLAPLSQPIHWHRLLLRAQTARRQRRVEHQQYQLAPFHSMTSSARTRIDGGTVRPSVLAVLRF